MNPMDPRQKQILLAVTAGLMTYLFLSRSVFLFVPIFVLLLLSLWKKGGGQMGAWEDDDPADWWKKGKQSEER